MKSILLALFFIGTNFFTYAQNEIAYVKVNSEKTNITPTETKLLLNENYFYSIKEDIVPQRVKEFQKVVANYDIKQADIYKENLISTYNVVFTEGNNVIRAEYDKNGNIIKSVERYEAVSLPYIFSKKITKENPGWGFEKVECNIDYNYNQQLQITYKVMLKNGNKKKTISIDALDFI